MSYYYKNNKYFYKSSNYIDKKLTECYNYSEPYLI